MSFEDFAKNHKDVAVVGVLIVLVLLLVSVVGLGYTVTLKNQVEHKGDDKVLKLNDAQVGLVVYSGGVSIVLSILLFLKLAHLLYKVSK